MTVINGIDVAVYECDNCGGNEMLLFRGQSGEGYKIVCGNKDCYSEQRDLIDELGLQYLWSKEEKLNARKKEKRDGNNKLETIR